MNVLVRDAWKVVVVALATTFGSALPARCQTGTRGLSAITERIGAEAQRLLRETDVPAISVGIVQDGDVVWAGAFGFADVAAGVPATPDTYFMTGSTLKPVTALAIMQLVDAEQLSLDDPLNSLLPAGKGVAGADDVTLRHLLAHFSGLDGPLDTVPLWGRRALKTPEETLAATHRVGAPGVEYQYCNVCYTAAGYVIELVSGLSYDEYVATSVFAPLGVNAMAPTRPTPEVVERLALPYGSDEGVTVPVTQLRTNVFAAGDAYLRPKDMAAFLAALLNLGTYHGHRILSEASAAEIMRPQFGSDGAGLGINIGHLDGRLVANKNGIFPGYRTMMIGDPASRDGAYVAANSSEAGRIVAGLADFALRLLWGEDPPPVGSSKGVP